MARIYKCKKVRAGDCDMLISDAPHSKGQNRMYPVTYGHDLAGNVIEQHEWVAPPPPIKSKDPLPASPAKYKEFVEKHGQQKLL